MGSCSAIIGKGDERLVEKGETKMLIDMLPTWRHVFKLDPQKELSDEDLHELCQSGTDAVMVGGTDGVTFDNTVELLGRIRRYELPCVQEVSSREAVVPGFDGYLVPVVLNASDTQWVVGAQHEAVKAFGGMIPWTDVVAEGYVVLNPHAKVAKLTGSRTDLTGEDITAFAEMAEHLLRLPILYVEYSGMYGDTKMVQAARKGISNTQLIYGGGIRHPEQAREMAAIADTVVVGNILYENLGQALRTVTAVKN
mgnify:CR=1 FL=1